MHIGINALLLKEQKSGTIGYIHNLIKYLAKVDTENYYTIFIKNRQLPNLGERFRLEQKKIKSNLERIAWEHLFFNKELKKDNIDLLHSTSFVSPIGCPVNTVLTIHDLAYFFYPRLFPKIKTFYYKKLIPTSIIKAQKIIAVSESVKKELIDFFKVESDKIDVIYCGIERIYKSLDKEISRDQISKKFNLKDKFILFVGTIEPRKNLETLIRAFYILNKKLDQKYKLVIAGPWGWLYKDMLKLIKRLRLGEKTIFTDYLEAEDLVYLYNSCDLFVYLSLYEGFGLPVLEAFACGAPVITSNISSLSEISGGAAILVNSRDSAVLADKMISVLEDKTLQKELIEKGKNRSKQFSWTEAAKKTLSVYEGAY